MSVQASVVIPTHQRRTSVERALRALCEQTAGVRYEVIASVNGSTDGTAEMVAAFGAPYRLRVVTSGQRGRAAACNAGIRAAQGDVIILLDDDMEPSPSLVAAHCEAHPPGSRRGVVGAAPIVFTAGSAPLVRHVARGFNSRLARLAAARRITFREAYTGNFSISRDVLLAAGGFDESFTLYGHEDYEMALRLVNAGVELHYSAAAMAWQHYEKDFAALALDCMERGETAVLFATKHPEVAASLKLSSYRRGSRRHRLLRSALLRATGLCGSVPQWVITVVACLERRQPPRLSRYYELTLDYFYWVGVRRALASGAGNQALWEYAR